METPTALPPVQDLLDSPLPRCACVLVLDTSSSMDDGPIKALNPGVSQFIREVQADEIASQCLELGQARRTARGRGQKRQPRRPQAVLQPSCRGAGGVSVSRVLSLAL